MILGGSPYVWYRCNIPEEQKETYLRVEEFVKKSATIKILGEVNHDDLPKTYAAMDVYVCPSIWEEPFGLVNIEAMACGLPVIGSIAGGIPEIVIDKETGLLVEKDNPGELAKAMEYFLNNREQIHTMGTAARHRVENKFSWEKHIDRLTEILNKINDSYS